MMSWAVVIILAVFLVIFEWVRWCIAMPPRPVVVSITAAAVCALAVWKIWKIVPYACNLELGRQGEVAVGQCLEKLVANGQQRRETKPLSSPLP